MKKIILLLSILLTQITASAFEVDALTFNIRFDTSKDGENACLLYTSDAADE